MNIVLGFFLVFSVVGLIAVAVMKLYEWVEWSTCAIVVAVFLFILTLFILVTNYRSLKMESMLFKAQTITIVNSEDSIYRVTGVKNPGAWLTKESTSFYTTKHYVLGQEIKD